MPAMLLAGSVMGLAGSVAAQDNRAEPALSTLSDAELEQRVREYMFAVQADHCTFGASLAQEMLRRQPNDRRANITKRFAEVNCAVQKGEFQSAYAGLVALETEGFIMSSSMGLFLAERTNNVEASLIRLQRYLNDLAKSPRLGDETRVAYATFTMLLRANEEQRLGALAFEQTKHADFSKLDPDMRSALASLALDQIVRTDPAAAPDLLAEIKSPGALRRLLLLRRYETIWPAVEQRVGQQFAKIDEEYLASARAAYEGDRGNPAKLNIYVNALWETGKINDIAPLVEQVTPASDDWSAIDEGLAWAINIQAFALDELGRTAEADQLFERLAEVENPYWQVNFVTNRAIRLATQGRWEEALQAQAKAEAVARDSGTDYSRGLAAEIKVCSLSKLGRDAEAAALLPQLRALGKDGAMPVAEALMCLGREPEGATLLTTLINDPVYGDQTALNLLPGRPESRIGAGFMPSADTLIDSHPELREALLRRVRLFPPEFQRVSP